jgi:hypothetical protein
MGNHGGSSPSARTMYHSRKQSIAIARVHGAAIYHLQSQLVVVHALHLKNAEGILNGTGLLFGLRPEPEEQSDEWFRVHG